MAKKVEIAAARGGIPMSALTRQKAAEAMVARSNAAKPRDTTAQAVTPRQGPADGEFSGRARGGRAGSRHHKTQVNVIVAAPHPGNPMPGAAPGAGALRTPMGPPGVPAPPLAGPPPGLAPGGPPGMGPMPGHPMMPPGAAPGMPPHPMMNRGGAVKAGAGSALGRAQKAAAVKRGGK